jgi:uncharacterized membrane protein
MAVLFRSRAAVIAEDLFLRRQLALYLERKTRRRRPSPVTKFTLVILSRFFPWASALAMDVLHLRHIEQVACFMFLLESLIDGPSSTSTGPRQG